MTDQDLRRAFDLAPMSRVQVQAVVLVVLLSALDGYDVLSMTFAAPAIGLAWGIGKVALGEVLSAGLVGMALGSFGLAPLADLVGRRWLVFISLVLMALGSLFCAGVGALPQLLLWRIVTGLGVGACVPVLNALAAEFSSRQRRPLVVALMAIGYPVGGLIGGALASILLNSFGWPAIFLAGAGLSAILISLVFWGLPEPLGVLVASKRPGALDRLNRFLSSCGRQPLSAMPAHAPQGRRGYADIFAPGRRLTVTRLTLANVLTAAVAYFVLTWLPQLVSQAGFSPSAASLVGASANLAGVLGGLLLGFFTRPEALVRNTIIVVLGLGLTIAGFGVAPAVLPMMFAIAVLCGFFLFASVAGVYGLLALLFRDESRASGAGFVIGVGRISSAAAPLLAGWLLASGLGRAGVSVLFGVGAVFAALALMGLSPGSSIAHEID